MEKVGWIFTQSSKERDYIMNSEEISQMAAWQDEVGQHCVTGVVSLAVSDEGSDVHFEAFQVRICNKKNANPRKQTQHHDMTQCREVVCQMKAVTFTLKPFR